MTGTADLERLITTVCRAAADVPGDVRAVVEQLTDRLSPLLRPADRATVVARAVARLDGLDVLEQFLGDRDVDEVMVNRGTEVWVDRGGRLTHVTDLPPGATDVVLERVLAPAGKRLDRTRPIVDVRLRDGARMCAVIEPVAVDGTTVAIRRHRDRRIPLDHFGPRAVCELLGGLVRARLNILVSGATSSGKTTLLAALVECSDPGDRLVVIEDTSELALADRHAVRLEARPAGVDGGDAVDVAQLVRTALRLRPDRLVVGEFRGDEVVAVVQALNTGHDGSLSTCHANSAIDAIHRLETLVMQAAPGWPLTAIRRQVTRSIDVVVHLQRRSDGHRSITEVVEIDESDGEPRGRTLVEGDRVVGDVRRSRR